MDLAAIFSLDGIVALVSLTFLEIVLGIDNIIFISIAADGLEGHDKKRATNIGLLLAMVMRIGLLFGIQYLIMMNDPWFTIDWSFMHVDVTGQAIVLLAGGIFLLYKSTKEIHEKVEHKGEEEHNLDKKKSSTIGKAIVQITLINVVFSFDSILTAVGMTNGLEGALVLMIIAVVLSVGVMMLFAAPVGDFVSKHPSLQILGLAFLILIGFMLIVESAHLSNAVVFHQHIGAVPKGYLYFAIVFALAVEFLNMKMRKNKK